MAVRRAESTQRLGEPTTRGESASGKWRVRGQHRLHTRGEQGFYAKRRGTHYDNRTRTQNSKSSERAHPAAHIVGPWPHAGKGWANLNQIAHPSAAGVDQQTVPQAKERVGEWMDGRLHSVHRQDYRAPDIRRVYIRKPGKQEKRPGVPTVADRALQRSTAQVLSAIYEQDFLTCSLGGRPGRSAHQALATLTEAIKGRQVSWVLEADLKHFFESLNPQWIPMR